MSAPSPATLARMKRYADVHPDYRYKRMMNGKTFIYYRSCSEPCAWMNDDNELFIPTLPTLKHVYKGPIKSCLLYLEQNRIGVSK